jgi:hypothetical protein
MKKWFASIIWFWKEGRWLYRSIEESRKRRIEEGEYLCKTITRLREVLGASRVGCIGGEIIVLSADYKQILLKF